MEHLTNTLNENKPVKIGRDGQEIEASVGYEVVRLMEAEAKAG